MSASAICKRCGATFSRPSSLKRHRSERRCSRKAGSQKSAKLVVSRAGLVRIDSFSDAELIRRFGRPARPRVIQGEVLDVIPYPAGIVSATRPLASPKRSPRNILDLRNDERPPDFFEPQAAADWRIRQWNVFSADYRNKLLAQRTGTAFTICPPQAKDEVVLRSQYHALKALATRLDAGIGTERERAAFEAGLREYNGNCDRIAQRRLLALSG